MAFVNRQQGFNLIELMAVLTIVGIVLAVGVPQLNSTIARGNISAEANRLVASINFARSQAVNKQQVVTLERKSNNTRNWTEGWIIYTDVGGEGNQAFAAGDVLLKDITTDTSGLSVTANSQGNQWISFLPSGRLNEAGGVSVAICNTDLTDGLTGSLLEINTVGRVKRSTIEAVNKVGSCTP